jgi:uncharacterized repeat protein (TIGR03809 family)
MTHRLDVARGRDIVARWCALAERRLEYLTELFETGRWRRFHSERAFLENIQEAKAAVEIWRDLFTREASQDNSPIDLSWPGRTGTSLPRDRNLRDQLHRLQPAQVPAEPPSEVPIVSETVHLASDEAPSAPDADAADLNPQIPDPQVLHPAALDNAADLTLDLAVMQQRYPLLRNAL